MFRSRQKFGISMMNQYANVTNPAIMKFMAATFGWMFMGLLCTALSAYIVLSSSELTNMVVKSFTLVIILQFAIVIILGFAFNKLSVTAARGLFILYSLLTGVTLSIFALIFTPYSIITALIITAVIFGVMSLYGYTTKEDLSKFRSLLMMGLIFIVVASLVNIFLHSPMLYYVVSYLGVIVFTALIGYDVNRIKYMAIQSQYSDAVSLKKLAIFAALQLYLDFINLFIFLLQIFGRRN